MAPVAGAVQAREHGARQAGAAVEQGGLVGLDRQQVVGLLRATRNSAAARWVWSASAVTTVPARSSGASKGAKAGTSSGAPPTWRWVTTARVAWPIAASRWTGRPSPPAPRAPRRVLPSTATAHPAGWGSGRSRSGRPGARHGGGQDVGVQAGQGAADRGLGRQRQSRRGVATSAERGTHRLGRISGPFGDRGQGLGAGHTAAAASARIPTNGWRWPRVLAGWGRRRGREQVRSVGSCNWSGSA